MPVAESHQKKEQFGSPEDVTTLFAWANMRGAKYRDFSASRAKAREEIRRRVQESAEEERLRLLEQAQRDAHEAAQRTAQEAAAQAEAIRRAEAERLAEIARQAETERQAVLAAQEAQRRAATHRQQSPISIPPPVTAPVSMPVESGLSGFSGLSGTDAMQQDIPVTSGDADPYAGVVSLAAWTQEAAAGSSMASGEAMREFSIPVDHGVAGNRMEFANSGIYPGMDENLYRAAPTEAPRSVPASAIPPYLPTHGFTHAEAISASSAVPVSMQPPASMQPPPPVAVEDWERAVLPSWLEELPHALPHVQGQTPGQAPLQAPLQTQALSQPEARAQAAPAAMPHLQAPAPISASDELSWFAQPDSGAPSAFAAPSFSPSMAACSPDPQTFPPAAPHRDNFPYPAMRMPMSEVAASTGMPRQDFPMSTEMRQPAMSAGTGYGSSAQDPLLASRERITRNWFALKSVFHPESAKPEQPLPRVPERVPALAVFSLAGGVGKTSLLAALARALSSRAERVLLVDLSAYGLMPFFFGARDQKPGQLRTFSPPTSTADAAIHLVTLDPERLKGESSGQDALVREVQQHVGGVNRLLIDLPTASGAAMRRVLRLQPTVLVPLTPDMNSVVSVGAIESFFQNQMAQSNAQSQPLYILNHFDPAQPLHADVRNLLREQIGNRLLPFVLRNSPAVSEALAEGMTVMDYAPGSVIAEDYLNLANWIRSLSAPAAVAPRGVRWSEQ